MEFCDGFFPKNEDDIITVWDKEKIPIDEIFEVEAIFLHYDINPILDQEIEAKWMSSNPDVVALMGVEQGGRNAQFRAISEGTVL